MRIAISIMAANNDLSRRNVEAMLDTFIPKLWKEDIKHEYRVYIYYSVMDGKEDVVKCDKMISDRNLNDRVYSLISKCEDGIYGTFEKTIEAYRKINDMYDYDIMIRLNISAFPNIYLLDKFMDSIDTNMVYSTAINTIIGDCEYIGALYPRGDFYIIGKGVLEGSIKYADEVSSISGLTHVDDVLMGVCIIKYYGESFYFEHLKQVRYVYIPHNEVQLIMHDGNLPLVYRVKTIPPNVSYSGFSWGDLECRKLDAEKMKLIDENISIDSIIADGVKNVLYDDEDKNARPVQIVQMYNTTLDVAKKYFRKISV